MKTYLMSHGLTEPQSFFFATILPLMLIALAVIWFGTIGVNLKGDTTTRSKVARVGGLALLWIILSFAWFWFINWLVPEPVLNAVTDVSRETQRNFSLEWLMSSDGSWPWVKIISSVMILVVATLSFLSALRASFFRDWRFTAEPGKAYWQAGPYWPCVLFVLGFFPSLIWMIWSPTLYLVPLMWASWRIGSWPVSRKVIERWVQQFNEHLFPNEDSTDRFGDCFFFGKEAPRPNWFQLLFGIPFCLPLSSVTVLSWDISDEEYPVAMPTKDGSMVTVSARMRTLTCDHPSVVMRLPAAEVKTLVSDSAKIAMNDIPDLAVKFDQKELRENIDREFSAPLHDLPRTDPRVRRVAKESMNDRIRRKVLAEKGNRILSIDFGPPMPSPTMLKAMEDAAAAKLNKGTAITNAEAAAEALTITNEAQVKANQKLFMAEAKILVESSKEDGHPISMDRAMQLVVERRQAEATRTVIAPGVGITVPINPS